MPPNTGNYFEAGGFGWYVSPNLDFKKRRTTLKIFITQQRFLFCNNVYKQTDAYAVVFCSMKLGYLKFRWQKRAWKPHDVAKTVLKTISLQVSLLKCLVTQGRKRRYLEMFKTPLNKVSRMLQILSPSKSLSFNWHKSHKMSPKQWNLQP